jgi:carboxyl-terminal processing protease
MNDASPPPLAHGPHESAGRQRSRRDLSSPWLGNGLFLLGTLFGMGLMLLLARVFPGQEAPDIAHYKEVRRFLLDTHVADIDRKQLGRDAIRGMFAGLEERLGDSYSSYYTDEQRVLMERDTSGHFRGIGVVFRGGEMPAQVLFPVTDGPADRAGLRVGDTLLSIDGTQLEGLERQEAYALLRGEVGRLLQVEVEGLDGRRRRHDIVLQELSDPSVRHVTLVDEERGIGYLALVGFSKQTTEQFDQAIRSLQAEGLRALVVDLRGNRGGVLSAAIEIAQRFIAEGRIVSVEGRGLPNIEWAHADRAKFLGLPLVVLIDRYSASASEVLAGALQDHRAAVLVGEATYGKGMVQTIDRYPEHDAIAKVTSSFYYTPAHRSLEGHFGHGRALGLTPDVLIEVSEEVGVGIERFLQRSFSAPAEAMAELRAWERDSKETLLPERPEDPVLRAALQLFLGNLPRVRAAGGE